MRRRADDLEDRLQRRLEDLARERDIAPKPLRLIGSALIVPAGLLRACQGAGEADVVAAEAMARAEVEGLSVEAVMQAERALGFEPIDVDDENRGYDIESRDSGSKRLRLIEVQGRRKGADKVTLTRNEVLCGPNAQDTSTYILALVKVDDGPRGRAALCAPSVRPRTGQRRCCRRLWPATTSGAINPRMLD